MKGVWQSSSAIESVVDGADHTSLGGADHPAWVSGVSASPVLVIAIVVDLTVHDMHAFGM
jgi:hypothetical protein